ncbi:MAG: hypothetical protein HFI38_05225 [Lachnospiraceae bacterium]|jgi:hypothetical protein|nr:hypothetical protein [Lachnospiraceae bacterium]
MDDRKEQRTSKNIFLTDICMEGKSQPVEERVKNSEAVLALARKFAGLYQIGLDVKQSGVGYQICLYFEDTLFTRYMLEDMAQLFLQCDDMSIMVKNVGDYDYMISLNYYTHDVYVNGRRTRLTNR